VDGDDNLHVLFSSEKGGKVFARSKINGVWESIATLSIEFGKHGSLAVARTAPRTPSGSKRTLPATMRIFTRPERLPKPGAPAQAERRFRQHQPSLVAVGPNNARSWSGRTSTARKTKARREIRCARIGSAYTTVIDIQTQHFPRVAVDSTNAVHVVCQTGGGDSGSGLRYTNNVGGTWKTPQGIGATFPKVQGLAADPSATSP